MAENSDDKKLLDHLLELGNLDGSKRQLTVRSDFVQKISSVWESFRQSVENRKILDVPNVFKELLRYTGFTIFDMDYEKCVDSSLKSQLLEIVLKTSESLRDYSKFQKLCKSLEHIIISPWPLKSVPTLLETKLEDLTLSAIDPVWMSEGWFLLEIRLEIMGRSKKMTMKELMIKLLHICVLQGKEWFRSSEDWKTYSLSTEVEEPFDPFRYSFNKYVNFLEIYFIFWLKYPELPHVDSIKDLSPGVMAKVLKSLRVQTTKSWDSVSGRMVPLIWKSTPTSIASKLVNQLFEAALQREWEVVGVKELHEQFVELFRESYDENEVEDKMRTTVTHILFKRERIYATNYIYALAEVILEKFGLTEKSRIIYVDAFMRAIMIDLNEIEVLRAQVPIKTDILRLENIKLAKRLDVLANFFKEFPKASRDLRLTAFSLNPTTEGFHNLFPNYKPKAKSQPKAIEAVFTSTLESNPSQSNSKETFNANNTESTESITETVQRTEIVPMEVETPEESPPVFDEDEDNFLTAQEDLNLPEDLKDDFATILIKPRWGALGHFCRGEELRSLCYRLIDGGHDLLIKGPDLQFVVVDYEKYAHLPSQYDPEDDGIERGFSNPNKRKYVRRPPGTPARRKPNNNNNNKKCTAPTGKARGRPKGWNRALSDQKKAAALKKRQNQNKPGTGRGRKSALKMRKIQQSLKPEPIPEPLPSRSRPTTTGCPTLISPATSNENSNDSFRMKRSDRIREMGRRRNEQVEQRSCVLTIKIKKHILLFKTRNPKDQQSSAWKTKLAKSLMAEDPSISPKDVQRWVKNHSWITGTNLLELEVGPRGKIQELRQLIGKEAPTSSVPTKKRNLSKNKASSDISTPPIPAKSNSKPGPKIIIKNYGIVGSCELHVTELPNGTIEYETFWTNVLPTTSMQTPPPTNIRPPEHASGNSQTFNATQQNKTTDKTPSTSNGPSTIVPETNVGTSFQNISTINLDETRLNNEDDVEGVINSIPSTPSPGLIKVEKDATTEQQVPSARTKTVLEIKKETHDSLFPPPPGFKTIDVITLD